MNLAIILTAAIGAYVLDRICAFIDTRTNLRNYHKGKFYRKKVQRLHDNAFYYYYDMTQSDPMRLSYDLASRDINRLRKENKIDAVYTKLSR